MAQQQVWLAANSLVLLQRLVLALKNWMSAVHNPLLARWWFLAGQRAQAEHTMPAGRSMKTAHLKAVGRRTAVANRTAVAIIARRMPWPKGAGDKRFRRHTNSERRMGAGRALARRLAPDCRRSNGDGVRPSGSLPCDECQAQMLKNQTRLLRIKFPPRTGRELPLSGARDKPTLASPARRDACESSARRVRKNTANRNHRQVELRAN